MRHATRIVALGCLGLTMSVSPIGAQEAPDPLPALQKAVAQLAISPVKERLPKLLKELVDARKSDEQIIEALYLAALMRLPTEQEAAQAKEQVADSKDRMAALEKVLKSVQELPEFARLHPMPNPLKVVPVERLPLEKRDPNALGKGPFFGRTSSN
jgi:hypothetical protein